jgi:ABC-type oligopeptide transport system substrate-binding subunit
MRFYCLLVLLAFKAMTGAAEPVFRFPLLQEPLSLDPQTSASSSGNYLTQNLYRGLLRNDAEKGLVFDGAKSCQKSRLALTCEIAESHKWSDGEKVKVGDYIRALRRLIDSRNRSPKAELLFSLKNARAIWAGMLPPEYLGVEPVGEKSIRFVFATPDSDFQYKLAHPALSPLRSETFPALNEGQRLLTTGPYRIKLWQKGNRVQLEANPFYRNGKRPNAEAIFIEDDSTALRMYEAGKLSLLRRLPAANIPSFRKRPDFFQVPMARFDYFGFSAELEAYPLVRKALSMSLDFENFREIFYSIGRPGCPSLPPNLYTEPVCLEFKPNKAKELLRKQPWPIAVNKQIGFSQLGGDDISRAAEWFQGQWSRNLGLKMELQGQEQGVYINRLKTAPPTIFRKGIGLDRPTCLAGLENFTSISPENFIHLKSVKFDKLVTKLREEWNAERAKRICTEGIAILIDQNRIIPLGYMHFSLLASPEFVGWKINSLNELDLAELRAR